MLVRLVAANDGSLAPIFSKSEEKTNYYYCMQILVCALPPDKPATAVWATTVIAAFAVVVGPLVTWFLTNKQIKAAADAMTKQLRAAHDATERQLEAARLTANKQIIAPIIEARISTLRNNLAEFSARASQIAINPEDYSLKDISIVYQLQEEICLMLNPNEPEHFKLEEIIIEFGRMAENAKDKSIDTTKFHDLRNEMAELARAIFKKEWSRVKAGDAD